MIDFEERSKELKELQAQTLDQKIQLSIAKIMEFYVKTNGECYVSCSGGADSMVLYDLCKKVETLLPNCHFKTVFSDTGLEDPSVRSNALSIKNICVVKPRLSFFEILKQRGYPVVSKEVAECVLQTRRYLDDPLKRKYGYRLEKLLGTAKDKRGNKSKFCKEKYKPLINAPFRISNECCTLMKKMPLKKIKEKPLIGTLAEESETRRMAWLRTGCNSFGEKTTSRPLSFWTKQDILQYIKENNIKTADCYGDIVEVFDERLNINKLAFSGLQNTGCIFCMFGLHLDTLKGGINRFEQLRQRNPQLFDYCMRGGKFDEQGLWIPDNGLGMAFIIEWLNKTLTKTLKTT
jgi:3'-phosphoadenosine 5'-phosphosulfate sulfotransferase (PAPS reductase)/FAD synthetase